MMTANLPVVCFTSVSHSGYKVVTHVNDNGLLAPSEEGRYVVMKKPYSQI
jgi:hypothetical protein